MPTTRAPDGGPLPSAAGSSITPTKSHPGCAPATDCDKARLTSPRLSEMAVTRTVTSLGKARGSSTCCSVSLSACDGSTTTARVVGMSASLELWPAPLTPGLVGFLLVLGQLQHREAIQIPKHGIRQWHVDAAIERLLGQPRCQRRQRRDV